MRCNDADKLTSITQGGNTVNSLSYDTAGRTTGVTVSGNTTTLAYDYEGRVTTITYPNSSTNTFTYNGLDTRVGKVDSVGTKTYLRDGADVTDPVLSDSAATYTPGISERRSSTTKFYHQDRLGSTERLVNTSQSTTDTREYDAFGLLTNSSGSTPTPFGFAGAWGYQEDPDSGLKLLGHRYYDPSTGRFLTRDPAKQGRNWLSYCLNNPTRWLDEEGLKPGDKFKNPDAAAKDAAKFGGGNSVETGGWIYRNPDGTYSYTYGESDNGANIDLGKVPHGPPGTAVVGSWHSHPTTEDIDAPGGIHIGGNSKGDTFSYDTKGNGEVDWGNTRTDIPGNHSRNDRGLGKQHWLAGGDGVVYRYDVPVDESGKSQQQKGKITAIGRWK